MAQPPPPLCWHQHSASGAARTQPAQGGDEHLLPLGDQHQDCTQGIQACFKAAWSGGRTTHVDMQCTLEEQQPSRARGPGVHEDAADDSSSETEVLVQQPAKRPRWELLQQDDGATLHTMSLQHSHLQRPPVLHRPQPQQQLVPQLRPAQKQLLPLQLPPALWQEQQQRRQQQRHHQQAQTQHTGPRAQRQPVKLHIRSQQELLDSGDTRWAVALAAERRGLDAQLAAACEAEAGAPLPRLLARCSSGVSASGCSASASRGGGGGSGQSSTLCGLDLPARSASAASTGLQATTPCSSGALPPGPPRLEDEAALLANMLSGTDWEIAAPTEAELQDLRAELGLDSFQHWL